MGENKQRSTPQRVQRIIEVVKQDSTAANAWNNLLRDGCDAELLAMYLVACVYSWPGLRETQAFFSVGCRRRGKAAARLAKKMRTIAGELQEADLIEELAIILGGIRLDDSLEDAAEYLYIAQKDYKMAARQKLDSDFCLLYLCVYVDRETGKKHYPEIATLLGSVKIDSEPLDPETVSKRVRRLKERLGPEVVKQAYRAATRIKPDKKAGLCR